MHIREIHLENFFGREQMSVQLPERGVVLVTGPNGAGKSALVAESIAVACFGSTLRGTPPWSGEPASVRIVTDELEIVRQKSGHKLLWNRHGDAPTKYDTPTKAQAALSGLVGAFDVWRRTAVLSSADAAHFSLATDKGRKLLLETILGLDRFDPALKECREDLRSAQNTLAALQGKATVLKERIAGTTDRLRDLEETEESEEAVVQPRIPAEDVAKWKARLQEIRAAVEGQENRRRLMEREQAKCDADAMQKKRACDRLDHADCPTCNQPIPKTMRTALQAEADAALEKSLTSQDAFKAEKEKIRLRIELLHEEADELKAQLTNAQNIERDYTQLEAGQARRAEKRTQLLEELRAARANLLKAEESVQIMLRDVSELEVCERVLGLRGVRAHMLEEALSAITELANGWLSRLFPGVTACLRESNDKVELEVHGLKHEYGYRANSSGQRRRVDLALLFALSDMEAASRGVSQGTLILDEAADSLDPQGLLAFADVIQEIAEERCVILITHNPLLYEGMTPVMCLNVQSVESEH